MRGREGPEEAWSSLLIGTPCSWTSLDGHTYLPNGKGPVNRLHYWTHLGFAPDKMTASLHGEWTLWLVVKENKSHGSGIRCHLLAGGDKCERSCTPIIKRWEKVRMYYQYLIKRCLPRIAASTEKSLLMAFFASYPDHVRHICIFLHIKKLHSTELFILWKEELLIAFLFSILIDYSNSVLSSQLKSTTLRYIMTWCNATRYNNSLFFLCEKICTVKNDTMKSFKHLNGVQLGVFECWCIWSKIFIW